MRRKINKKRPLLQAILNSSCQLQTPGVRPHKKASRAGRLAGAIEVACPVAQRQPPACIKATAALFLAPICWADTPSALKVPRRFRTGLLPKPRSGYSLLASA